MDLKPPKQDPTSPWVVLDSVVPWCRRQEGGLSGFGFKGLGLRPYLGFGV